MDWVSAYELSGVIYCNTLNVGAQRDLPFMISIVGYWATPGVLLPLFVREVGWARLSMHNFSNTRVHHGEPVCTSVAVDHISRQYLFRTLSYDLPLVATCSSSGNLMFVRVWGSRESREGVGLCMCECESENVESREGWAVCACSCECEKVERAIIFPMQTCLSTHAFTGTSHTTCWHMHGCALCPTPSPLSTFSYSLKLALVYAHTIQTLLATIFHTFRTGLLVWSSDVYSHE